MTTLQNSLPSSFLETVRALFPADFLSQVPSDLEMYGKDWTKVYLPKPSAVVFPRSTQEVSKILALCFEQNIPVVPSGGRTGLAGGAVAAHGEIVLSLTRLNKIYPVDALAQTVKVQAGAVTEAVHQFCEPQGLTWPVDFSSKGSSHVGGNISTNAGGVKVIHYGMTREWVLGLQVVLMDGSILELNGGLEKNNTGIDLRQLFIGSEGTLGVVTEATLKLTRLPRELEVFFFALKDTSEVFKLFQEARRGPFILMAFETLTDNCLAMVETHLHGKTPFQNRSGAYALMEVERPETENGRAILDQWLESMFEKGLVLDGTLAQSPKEARELWKLREGIGEALFNAGMVHKNDIALPVGELETFIEKMNQMFVRVQPDLEVFLFGHIGDGNLHVNTMKPIDMDKGVFLERCKIADQELFSLVKEQRGSVSAEHGIGLLKKDYLGFSRSQQEIGYFRQLKKTFDPKGLLNPGKVFD